MTILDSIVEHKRVEILKRKARRPLSYLQEKPHYQAIPNDPGLRFHSGQPGIIAEFKRKSPSRGMIHGTADPVKVVSGYRDGGAAVASVLTDRDFFGGSLRDLEEVRFHVPDIPLLRKDFIIDPYQVYESKAYGADIILLIAAILDKQHVEELAALARSLGLTVLLEIHGAMELDRLVPGIRMVGVNNRNLKDFVVDTKISENLVTHLPADTIKISESGITSPEEIRRLMHSGYDGFLIGERFMKEPDPVLAMREFIETI